MHIAFLLRKVINIYFCNWHPCKCISFILELVCLLSQKNVIVLIKSLGIQYFLIQKISFCHLKLNFLILFYLVNEIYLWLWCSFTIDTLNINITVTNRVPLLCFFFPCFLSFFSDLTVFLTINKQTNKYLFF